ncbi:MAG: carbohydrate-binding module family 14 protein [Odoribacteraceae bacterium]|jgi:hypothetical protein|nr:carbohydrate-binding module family 14 protein [Odoribacteraceae bacterium]
MKKKTLIIVAVAILALLGRVTCYYLGIRAIDAFSEQAGHASLLFHPLLDSALRVIPEDTLRKYLMSREERPVARSKGNAPSLTATPCDELLRARTPKAFHIVDPSTGVGLGPDGIAYVAHPRCSNYYFSITKTTMLLMRCPPNGLFDAETNSCARLSTRQRLALIKARAKEFLASTRADKNVYHHIF